MAKLIVFHHAQGLTDGVRAFADALRAAGHVVHAPDLCEGETFAELADGMRHVDAVGFDTIVERGRLDAEGLPDATARRNDSLTEIQAQLRVAEPMSAARSSSRKRSAAGCDASPTA